jgi:lysophospholipase L1-like esterase
MAAQPRFPWLRLTVLLLVLLLFGATVGEVALRLPELRCAGGVRVGQRGVFQLDAEAGYVMRPNVCVRLTSGEYDQVLRTNSRGLIGPEVPAGTSAEEFRVVVLGDSYTAAGQVPYEQSFTPLLETRLRASGYGPVRVINAGVGGWSTINEAGYLRAHAGWLMPDVVVVAAFVGNDIGENVLATRAGYREWTELEKGFTWGDEAVDMLEASYEWFPRNGYPQRSRVMRFEPGSPLPTPTFAAGSPQGEAEASAPPPGELDSRLASLPQIAPDETLGQYRERLATLARADAIPSGPGGRFVNELVRRAAVSRSTLQSSWRDDSEPASPAARASAWDQLRGTSRLLTRVFGEPAGSARAVTTAPRASTSRLDQAKMSLIDFEWTILRDIPGEYWLDVAWPLFGNYLSALRDTAASTGAPTLLVIIPHMGQFDDEMHARIMADYRFRQDEVDWERPQRAMRIWAERLSIPVLDLLPVFRERADRASLYLREDMHFSALAHRVTAEQLAGFISETLPANGQEIRP